MASIPLSTEEPKIAIVTGASSPAGQEIVLCLINKGMRVVGCAKTTENLIKLQQTIDKTHPKVRLHMYY